MKSNLLKSSARLRSLPGTSPSLSRSCWNALMTHLNTTWDGRIFIGPLHSYVTMSFFWMFSSFTFFLAKGRIKSWNFLWKFLKNQIWKENTWRWFCKLRLVANGNLGDDSELVRGLYTYIKVTGLTAKHFWSYCHRLWFSAHLVVIWGWHFFT